MLVLVLQYEVILLALLQRSDSVTDQRRCNVQVHALGSQHGAMTAWQFAFNLPFANVLVHWWLQPVQQSTT